MLSKKPFGFLAASESRITLFVISIISGVGPVCGCTGGVLAEVS